MSEVQEAYRGTILLDYTAEWSWDRVALELNAQIFQAQVEAADLSGLADYRGGAIRLWHDEKGQNVAIDDKGMTRYYYGESAIAEAAAFVRGGE